MSSKRSSRKRKRKNNVGGAGVRRGSTRAKIRRRVPNKLGIVEKAATEFAATEFAAAMKVNPRKFAAAMKVNPHKIDVKDKAPEVKPEVKSEPMDAEAADADMEAFKTQIVLWQNSLKENYDMVDIWVEKIKEYDDFDQLNEFLDKNESTLEKYKKYKKYLNKECPWQAGEEQRGGGFKEMFDKIKNLASGALEFSTDIVAWIWEQVKNFTIRAFVNTSKLVNCLRIPGTINFAILLVSGYYLHSKCGPDYSEWIKIPSWMKDSYMYAQFYVGFGGDPSPSFYTQVGDGAKTIYNNVSPYLSQLALMGALYMNSITSDQFGLIMSVITQKKFMDEQLNLKYVMFAATTLLSTMGTFVASIRSKKFEECWNSEGGGEGEGVSEEDIKEVMELFGNGLNGFQGAMIRNHQHTATEGELLKAFGKGQVPAQADLNNYISLETDMFNIIKEALRPSDPADPDPTPEPDLELADRIQELIQEGLDFNNHRKNKNRFTELTNKVINSAKNNEEFASKMRTFLEKINEAKNNDKAVPAVEASNLAVEETKKFLNELTPPPPCKNDKHNNEQPQIPSPSVSSDSSDSDSGSMDLDVGKVNGGARKRRKTRKHRKRKTRRVKRMRKDKKSLKKKKRKTKKR